ncbi:hypothetical protein MMC17_009229 [Xylographa soralifera]|nr:hypothetical protein [Xylographa soralifera]
MEGHLNSHDFQLRDLNPSPVDQAFHRHYRRSYKRNEHSPVQEPFLERPSSVGDKPPHLHPLAFVYKWWFWEVLTITLSIAATAAIVIVLREFDSRPPPELPSGVTLNAIVSLLSTVAKAPMLAVVSACLGNLKWRWFMNTRALEDFETFDSASRGPYGAIQMIARKHPMHMATIGAVITLLALFVDPFIQQIITYPLLPIPTSNATVPRSQLYDADIYAPHLGSGINVGPEFGMKAAIYKGIFTSASPSDVTPDCATGNCTFPLFDTLAICNQTTLSQQSPGEGGCGSMFHYDQTNYTYALPGSTNVQISACTSDGGFASGVAMISTVDVSDNMSSSVLGVSNPITSLAILQFPGVNAEGYHGTYSNATPLAWECSLYYCLNTYNVSVINNNATTQLVSTYHSETGTPIPYSSIEDTPDGILQRPSNSTVTTGNSTFRIQNGTVAALSQYMNYTLSGQFLTKDTEVAYGTFVNDVMQALNITADIGSLMGGLATSMTNYLRELGNSGNDSQAQGAAYALIVHVHIRWAWLALSGILVVLSIGLLIATMILSVRSGLPVWKSSSLDTIFHGPGNGSGMMDRSATKAITPSAMVVLGQASNGDWRLLACLRVNWMFYREATKWLWDQCGFGGRTENEFFGPRWPGLYSHSPSKIPKIRHLAALASDPVRLDWYAKHLHTLFFATDVATDGDASTTAFVHESQYHRIFVNTSFPLLRLLDIDIPQNDQNHHPSSSLVQYLQPSLEYCQITGGTFSDQFLFTMQMQCKHLTTLILERNHDLNDENISEQGMVDFIHSMPSLELLHVRDFFHSSRSLKIFLAIAQHENLEELKLPRIPDGWIPELASVPPESMFRKTDLITFSLSDASFETLLPCLVRINCVVLNPLNGHARRALRCASRCPGLIALSLQLEPDEVLQERDLLQLNDGCPELFKLYIQGFNHSTSSFFDDSSKNIGDTTIDQVARYHPELLQLEFFLTGATLTENSILSVNRYCKNMSEIELSADVFLESLLRNDHQNLFPELKILKIRPPPSDRRQYSNPEQMAKRLLEAAPKLRTLDLGSENLSPSEEVVNGIVNELIKGRLK